MVGCNRIINAARTVIKCNGRTGCGAKESFLGLFKISHIAVVFLVVSSKALHQTKTQPFNRWREIWVV